MKVSDSQKNWLGGLAQRYHDALSDEVLSYLDERGLAKDTVDSSLLGLVADPDPVHVQFEGRLSIPFITPTGVVYMRFRCLEKHDCKDFKHGKYEGPAGAGTHLYNISALHTVGSVVGVCEGELDALAATGSGLPSVGVPGSQNWKPFYRRLFDDFERVIVLGDGDTAGRAFTAKLAGELGNVIQKPMPKDHDVSSYVVEYGAEAFLEFAGVA